MITDAVLGIVLLGHAAAFWAIPIVALRSIAMGDFAAAW